MATEAQLLNALKNADAAGDTNAARKLASAVLALRQQGGQQQPAAAQPEQPERYVDPNASRGMFAVDRAQTLAGNAIEGTGRFIEQRIPAVGGPMAEYGRSVVEKNEADIARRGYQSTYQGSFRDQEGVADKIGFVGEKMVENAIPTLATYGGYAAAALAAPYSVPVSVLLALGTTIGTVGMGIGETTDELKSKVSQDDYNPNAAVIGGTIVGLLDRFGATKALGVSKAKLLTMSLDEITAALRKAGKGKIAKNIMRGMAVEGVTEAAQENVIMGTAATQGAEYTGDEVLDRNIDSAVLGAAMGGAMTATTETAGKATRLFKDDGSIEGIENLTREHQQAAATFARRLDKIATGGDLNGNTFDLQDIDKMSQTGARAVVEAAHTDLVGEIVDKAGDLKELLRKSDQDTFDQRFKKVRAAVAQKMARNKTKSVVTAENFLALEDLVGGYTEGQALMNLIRESQIMTEVHNNDYQGKLSKFTDMFSVLGGGTGYDKSAVAVERVVRPIASLSFGFKTSGLSLLGQQAVASIGQRLDKARGTYSSVDKFIKENKDKAGLPAPRPPSFREQRLQQAQQASSTRAGLQAYNKKRDGGDNSESPVGKILAGTGLSPDGLNKLLDYIETAPDTTPDVMVYVDQTRRNLAGEGNRIEDISPWIQAINGTLNESADLDALREDQPDNPLAQRARRRAGFGPSPDQSSAGTAQQQPQGRSPAVQSGIDANNALADRLLNGMESDQSIPDTQKDLLRTALIEFGARTPDGRRGNIGAKGQQLANALDIVERLRASGVVPRFVNDYIMPYVQRVAQQDAGRSGRQQPPTSTGGTDLALDEDFETPRSPSMAQVMHEEMYQSSPKMRARQARELGLDINQKQIRELLKKRGKRRGQDFDYVDPLIEARDTRKSRTPTEIEKLQARQAEIEASRKAMQQKFADERNAEVERYEREKAARKATRDNLLAAARQARKLGRKVRSSSGRDGKISSYYVSALTGPDLRISDHEIPANPRREFMAQENGRSDYNGYYGPELIVDDTTTDAEVLAFLNGTDLALDEDFDASYRMQHQPQSPEDGAARLDDMTGGGNVFPDDIYGPNGLRYYGNPRSQADQESYAIIQEVVGDPDATVTIYRAVPDVADIDTINAGDFVTLSRTYAEDHGESGYGPMGQDAGKILSKTVKVREVYSEGNDLNEFGYFPSAEQSFDQDIAGQSAGALTQQPAQQPQQQSPFNMKALVNKMLGSQPATPDQVKAQLPEVRAVFEIGKKGSKYEDGIQDIDAALQLSKALNVSVRLFDSQQAMFDDMGRPLTEDAKGIRGAYYDLGRTVWGMNAGAHAETLGNVNDLYALTTVLHELGHAAAKDSGFENIIERMIQDNSEYSDSVRKRVLKEIANIQKNIDLYTENNPKQRRPVRPVMAALQARKEETMLIYKVRVNRFLDYINQADERAVDPVLLYLLNPRLAKAVAPTTSRLIKENINAMGNPDLTLHAFPFATIVAVVLAMLANGRAEEEEEKKQRQQMPAGALSPQAGALSSQQQFAA